MQIIQHAQGTPEWLAHRATCYNASDVPAMLGISPYKTRTQLMHEMATGITPDVDAATQRQFDDGHRFEALARPYAEQILDDDLYPVFANEDKYGLQRPLSASSDGLNMEFTKNFEHKRLNADLRRVFENDEPLLELHTSQMEQQHMVFGVDETLFMGSKFDQNGELEEKYERTYKSDPAMRERILAGWAQFEIDLEEYKRKLAAGEIEQPKAAPKAEAIQALPSVFVQATGMVTASNLAEFKEAATLFIAAIKTELVSDQDFADAESTVKFCKEAETNLEATKASVLAQMSTVDEVVRTLDHIKKQLADKRLMLDKLVKSEKEQRKGAIVTKADKDFTEYAMQLEVEIKPIGLNRATVSAARMGFADAIKGLKSLASMQEKVDNALRDAKFAVDQEAADIRKKLAWCKENAAGQSALFPDLQSLMVLPMDAFALTITSRIEKQKADEAARLEAETARIRAEEEAKATAKAQAEAEAILAERAKQAAESANDQRGKPPVSESERATIQSQDQVADRQSTPPTKRTHANRAEILEALSENFGLPEEMMLEWILAEFADDFELKNRKAA